MGKLRMKFDSEMEKQREINLSLIDRYESLSQKLQSVDSQIKGLSQKLFTFDERMKFLEGSNSDINLVN